MSSSKPKYSPDADYRFFLYDPSGNGMEFFCTEEHRDAAADAAIEAQLDDGWAETVTEIVVGEVTKHTVARAVELKPVRSDYENDQEFEDAIDDWGDIDHEYKCRYELAPLDDSGDETP